MKKQLSLLVCLFFVAMQSLAQPAPQRSESASDLPRYELEIKLDPDQHRLEGRGTLWIPATNEPRNFIRLGLDKNMRDLIVEVMEPEESAGAIALEPGLSLGPTNGWIVRPAKPFPAGRPVRLRYAWQGGEKSSFVFYLGPEGSFASAVNTAWYPLLFTLPVKFAAQTVALDPHFQVLRWTPEYRAAVATASAQPLPAAEQELFNQEQALVAAIKRGDRETLSRLLADDFSQKGMLDWSRPLTKAEWIEDALRVFSGYQAPEFSFTKTSVRLRAQMGIVNTIFTVRETSGGKTTETSYALLNVWSKETGKWQMLARHLERLPSK